MTNNVDGFEKTALTDANQTTALTHSTSAYANNAWTVEASTINADGSQSVKMKNVATIRRDSRKATKSEKKNEC